MLDGGAEDGDLGAAIHASKAVIREPDEVIILQATRFGELLSEPQGLDASETAQRTEYCGLTACSVGFAPPASSKPSWCRVQAVPRRQLYCKPQPRLQAWPVSAFLPAVWGWSLQTRTHFCQYRRPRKLTVPGTGLLHYEPRFFFFFLFFSLLVSLANRGGQGSRQKHHAAGSARS